MSDDTARRMIEAMAAQPLLIGHYFDKEKLLRALRALAEAGPSEAMIRVAVPMFDAMIRDSEWPFSRNLWSAMLAQLIAEIERIDRAAGAK
jgi:hypothetical protein